MISSLDHLIIAVKDLEAGHKTHSGAGGEPGHEAKAAEV